MPRRFVGIDELDGAPHLMVDGAARPGTVQCLSHWPHSATPARLSRDLSAEIALAYLRHPRYWRDDVSLVTNDHFDEDGLAALFVLTEPERALASRDDLVGFARAGDFDVITDDRFAAAVLATRALVAAVPSATVQDAASLSPTAQTARCYQELLPKVPELLAHPEHYHELFEEEAAQLDRSRAALTGGAVQITEVPEIDLAVVAVPEEFARDLSFQLGHRGALPLHPMALHTATSRPRVLVHCGAHFSYHDRYETWVAYRSRRLSLRRDLTALASRLNDEERGEARWEADPPGALVAVLNHEAPSTIETPRLLRLLGEHLARAPVAWDPFAGEPGRR